MLITFIAYLTMALLLYVSILCSEERKLTKPTPLQISAELFVSFFWFGFFAHYMFKTIKDHFYPPSKTLRRDKKKYVTGLTGLAGSGKSTVANYLVKHGGYTEISFADPLKRFCAELFSVPLETFTTQEGKLETLIIHRSVFNDLPKVLKGFGEFKLTTGQVNELVNIFLGVFTEGEEHTARRVLQLVGTEVFRSYKDSFWTDLARDKILSTKGHVVISDVRFDNEAEMLAEFPDQGLIALVRDGVGTVAHVSEQGVSSRYIHMTIHNTETLEALENALEALIEAEVV